MRMAGDLRCSFENQSEPRTSKMYRAIFFASMVLTGCASQDNLRYSPTLDKAFRTSTGDAIEVCVGRHRKDSECSVMSRRHVEQQLSQILGHF